MSPIIISIYLILFFIIFLCLTIVFKLNFCNIIGIINNCIYKINQKCSNCKIFKCFKCKCCCKCCRYELSDKIIENNDFIEIYDNEDECKYNEIEDNIENN